MDVTRLRGLQIPELDPVGATRGQGQAVRGKGDRASLLVLQHTAARLASAPILFSLDDDAVFSTPTIVEATLRKFDHPRIGAVAIPFVNVNHGPAVLQQAPQREQVFATYDYIGTAHALRRDLFLELGADGFLWSAEQSAVRVAERSAPLFDAAPGGYFSYDVTLHP